ncbi:purine-nucleoside phosphorylase [Ruminococcaceae bacterium OttesenSCG-928-A16]|nr:purine-nucleoside phosphorylase [Ruminococcaceae bacterium OttesenSCG-928-A16]
MTPQEKLQRCYQSVRAKTNFTPAIALILGSGLGDFAENITVEQTIAYQEIEGFPVSTVRGHKGRFIFGTLGGVPVVAMQGRVHYYEGYTMQDVVLPTRLMGLLGAKVLFLTNAAGGVNQSFSSGDFMLIEDQISCFVPSPLIGANLEELGTRFPDMTTIYDKPLRETIANTASSLSIPLQKGVYIQLSGPQFETPAEVRMCGLLGADAAGMSTACEAIAAHHMGLRVCGISCISNMAAGISGQPLTHQEVDETAARVAPQFKQLITSSIIAIGNTL